MKSGIVLQKISLKENHIRKIFDFSFFFLQNLKTTTIDLGVENDLTASFKCKDETSATLFFNSYLKGKYFSDIYGVNVFIPDKGVRHMYKDNENKTHTISSCFFELYRGKRLSLIVPTLQSCVIVTKYDKNHKKTSRIYVSKFQEKYNSGTNVYFFVVVTHGSVKDGFNFTTAYRVEKDNQIIKIIQGHDIIKK